MTSLTLTTKRTGARRVITGVLLAAVLTITTIAMPAQDASAAGTTGKGCTAYNYSYGGWSGCIGLIQRMLNGINYVRGVAYGGYALSVDNSFGPNTNTQVRRFQSYAGLVSDGIVGPNTWNQLCRYAGASSNYNNYYDPTPRTGWQAAYDAGCWVQKPAGAGYTRLQKY